MVTGRKVIFYMFKQYSYTSGLVKDIYVGNIQKRKSVAFLLRFGVSSDASKICRPLSTIGSVSGLALKSLQV